MRKIVLASKSPRRRELLSEFVSDFDIIADDAEEITEDGITPEETVRNLAMQKARNVAKKADESALVIGADTVVFIDGKILGKPANKEEASEMLHMLSGRDHHVCTGLAIIDNESKKSYCGFERTAVHFRHLEDEEIERYIATGEPMDKAGAYGIQGKCAIFVDKINGDYNNVVGLPVAAIYRELKKLGIDIYLW